MLEMSVQPLLGCHLSGSRKQCVPRIIGKPGSRTCASSWHGATYESPRFLWHRSDLENQMQVCTNGNAQQQLQRQVGYPAVHDLAQRGLRYPQQLRRGCLTQLLPLQKACDLQSNVVAQRLDGRDIFWLTHSYLTIVLVN